MRTWRDTQSCDIFSGRMLLSWPLSREGLVRSRVSWRDSRASDILAAWYKLEHGGISSNGRAPALHAGSTGIDTRILQI